MKKIVAIHQPNFFPWLGYFNKIVRSDIFVFLDHVQYPRKNGATMGNRVKFLMNQEERWLTVPTSKKNIDLPSFNQVEFDDSQPWRKKMKNTLKMNYARSNHFKEVIGLIENILDQETNNLAEFNINTVMMLLNYMEINDVNLVKSSDLLLSSSSTQLLIDVVKAVGGDSYLAGGGAQGYQEDELFKEQGVELIYQNYQHPTYEQKNNAEFIKGLSIIDALMNVGKDKLKQLLYEKSKNA